MRRHKRIGSDRPRDELLVIPAKASIASVIERYLEPAGPKVGGPWLTRATRFLLMHGAVFAGGKLQKRTALVDAFAIKVETFACEYLVNRLRQLGELNSKLLERAMVHVPGAAREAASIFVDALVRCHAFPGERLRASRIPRRRLRARAHSSAPQPWPGSSC